MLCPICNAKNLKKDYDYPESIRICDTCGCEFMIDINGNLIEITINSTEDLE